MEHSAKVLLVIITANIFFSQAQRNEVECHLQSAMRAHLDMACVKLNKTQIQLNSAQEAIRKLEETTRTLEEKFQTTTKKLKEKFQTTTKKLEEKFQTATKKLKEKLEETIVEVEECKEITNGLERKFGEETGVHTWKISDFGKVLREAIRENETEIESDIFYDCNYKFFLSLYPNGNGPKNINHLSIYLHILEGEYDAMLSWPFSKRVSFTLIDQQENPEDREDIVDSFRARPKDKECFRRPVEEVNTGFGIHKFVSHSKLRKRRYIVDDTIFIQVEIAPPQCPQWMWLLFHQKKNRVPDIYRRDTSFCVTLDCWKYKKSVRRATDLINSPKFEWNLKRF